MESTILCIINIITNIVEGNIYVTTGTWKVLFRITETLLQMQAREIYISNIWNMKSAIFYIRNIITNAVEGNIYVTSVSYTHLTLPTNREV